jgi:hypothetical protein
MIHAYEGTTTVTRNLNEDGRSIALINDGSVPLTLQVNQFSITIKGGESFESRFLPFKNVTITTAGTPYRLFITN